MALWVNKAENQLDATNSDLLLIDCSSTYFGASLRPSSGGPTAFHCLWFLSCCSCCGAGEAGGKMYVLCRACCLRQHPLAEDVCTVQRMLPDRQHPLHNAHILPPDSPTSQQLQQDRNHRQWNAVPPPDDGRKDARNMLRNNWWPISHYLLHLVGSRLYLLIEDARSFEHKVCHYDFIRYLSALMLYDDPQKWQIQKQASSHFWQTNEPVIGFHIKYLSY